jgi:hypothetical protein
MDALAHAIAALEDSGPRTFARWSPAAWRAICAGPATELWQRLTDHPDKDRILEAYLTLVHAAVGLQYVAVAPSGALSTIGFLATALCRTAPQKLAPCTAKDGLHALAAIWNIGERLQAKAPWLDRYLAARLDELSTLGDVACFVERAIDEGTAPMAPAAFSSEPAWQVLDCAHADRRFLPGECHLATPSIICVHDRLRPGVHVAVLLRKDKDALPLGATACLGQADAYQTPAEQRWQPMLTRAQIPEPCTVLATQAGFLVCATLYSQRIWIGRVA